MYCVRRVRLENIGHRSARFGSLILDLTGGPSTVDGRPLTSKSVVDTILWLRNGGGKSSLLALLFSLLLPAKVDFIGHADDKSLADYVPDGKVSHVLVEWEDSERPEAGATLVTGGVYQWQDGQCPADPSAGWDRLIRRWYLFRPAAGILDLDSIPIRHDSRQLSQSSFLRAIEETHKSNRHVRLVVAKEQYQWADQLQQYGLDPQVFKIQREMNKGEGGITDLFRFTTCEEFIDFLIDMVVNPAGPTAARGVLTEHADKLATVRPGSWKRASSARPPCACGRCKAAPPNSPQPGTSSNSTSRSPTERANTSGPGRKNSASKGRQPARKPTRPGTISGRPRPRRQRRNAAWPYWPRRKRAGASRTRPEPRP